MRPLSDGRSWLSAGWRASLRGLPESVGECIVTAKEFRMGLAATLTP